MDIAATKPPAPAAPAPASQARSALNSDFTTFLKMMTTQMQNQDPLNPLNSNDFATQLATFSGVEQQVRTNDLLSALGSRLGLTGMAQYAGWVGMDARAAMPVSFTGAPVELTPAPAKGADRAELVVSDGKGNEVQRLAIPVSDQPVRWAGTGPDGTPLPQGTYHFTLDSFAGDERIATTAVESYARVTEARTEKGNAVLIMSNGARIAADAVTGLREPA